MTIVRIRFGRPSDGGPLPTAGTLRFTPTRERVVAGDPDMIVLPMPFSRQVPKDTGQLDVDLSPSGPGWVWEIYSHSFGVAASYRWVVVPVSDEPVDYTELARVDPKTLEATLEPDPLLWAELESAKALASDVDAAKSLAEGARDTAQGHASNASTSAGDAAVSATAAAGSATSAGSARDTAVQAAADAVAPTDQKIADVIGEEGTAANTALTAAIAQSLTTPTDAARAVERPNIEIIQSLKSRVAQMENRSSHNPIRVVRLINGATDPTPTSFAGVTTEKDTIDGRPAWRITKTTGPSRLDITLAQQLEAGPVSAVSLWVYITEPEKVTGLRVSVYGDGTTWTRERDQPGTNFENLPDKSFKKGWNLVRFRPTASAAWKTVQTPSRVNVVFLGDEPTVNYVHTLDLEVREKATVMIVCDWGSKPFYDNAYPDMKARGWPVIWAPRTERFGDATYPDNMTTLAEVKALMSENGNEVSWHSPRGSATSGLTADEARAEVLDSLVGLKVHGVYTDGALWRAAWVQNVSPNAHATHDLMVASATPNDRYHSGPWPPLDRYDIPRSGMIRGYGTGNKTLDILRETHGFDVFYTHGVLPDADHSPGNHASQSEWDALVADLDVAVAEGWLEILNFRQVLERYPLERHLDEKVILVTPPAVAPDPEPDLVITTLVSGENDQTPTSFAEMTVSHGGIVDGRPAWKVESTGGPCRLDIPVVPEATAPGLKTFVTFWIHVTDPSAFTQANISVRGAAGNWTRDTTQPGLESGWPLQAGWNEIRYHATSALSSNLDGAKSVNVALTKTGDVTAHFGAVTIESEV